ncbi:MAG: hypothetical protein HQL19_01375 [Candidatus Omnitrophica bacterium]|nr:hypothetical protein [Candidatus Omnitrophota bacterium]
MIVCILLPWVFFWFSWRLFSLKGFEWREAFLAAFLLSGIAITFSTEVLSVFAALNFWTICSFWVFCCVVAGGILWQQAKKLFPEFRVANVSSVEWALLGAVTFILAVTLFIALYAPPNTWDSMTYHMSRVMHWIQDHGVMNYPTCIPRQLVIFPYAEYAVLHMQILIGGDRFANLVQWTAFAGCALGASLIARELGVARVWQIASALGVLTLPMAIFQATSTQNDLVAALWTVSVVVFTLFFLRQGMLRWAVLAAMALALALMTKGIAVIFGAPFLVLALLTGRAGIRNKSIFLILTISITVLVAAPFYSRLCAIGPSASQAMAMGGNAAMGKVGVLETVSNMSRGIATELASPWTGWNNTVVKVVEDLHRALKISLADPQTTAANEFSIRYCLDEDYMPAPLHMIFVLAAGVMFWLIRRKSALLGYALAIATGAVFFCIMVKWQPWISRFHLVFFVLAVPLVVAVLTEVLPRKAVICLIAVLFLGAIHPLLENNTRRLISEKSLFHYTRKQAYFMKHPSEYPVVGKFSEIVHAAGCHDVGISIGGDDWEYPWHVFLGPGVRIESVNVAGALAVFAYPLGDFTPCAVVASSTDGEREVFNGRTHVRVLKEGKLSLYFDAIWVQNRKSRP